MSRKIKGHKEYECESMLEWIAAGRTTWEELQEANPSLAEATRIFERRLQKDRRERKANPYTLRIWEKGDLLRVYVNGGRLANERDCKAWIEADESLSTGWAAKGRGDWYSFDTSFAQTGAKPWQVIAAEALIEAGVDEDSATFDDIIAAAKR